MSTTSMSERQSTLICSFDPRSPRITAYHIHEWIYDNLRIDEDDVRMIQVDGHRRKVYIKFTREVRMEEVLKSTKGQLEYRYENGEISQVTIDLAGMGIKKIRLACLPPEVKDISMKECMTKYDEVKSIRDELWSSAYRHKVYIGVRVVEIHLKKHIPSHLSIAGNDTIITYDGQPPTCFKCNETGHQQIDCPRRNRLTLPANDRRSVSWADMVANTSRSEMPDMSACRSNGEDGKEIESSSGHMFETSGMDWNNESQVLCSNPEVQDLTEHQDVTGTGGQGPSSIGTFQACPQEHYQGDETLNNPTNNVDKLPDQTTDTGMTSSCMTVMEEVMTEVGSQHV